uniref:Prolyl 4-hydroxylase alpha subunit domain-containing protein n=2 Tax=Choreotrichia TaxID=141411 RepID=A0A7S3VUV8_9SPIT
MPKRPREEGAAVLVPPNTPLRNKALLEDAARAHAAHLIQSQGRRITAMKFCAEVLHDRVGLKDYAVGQWERTIISAARKSALGEHDSSCILKPPPPVTQDVPSIEAAVHGIVDSIPKGGAARKKLSVQARAQLEGDWRKRISGFLDADALKELEMNGGIVRQLLTGAEVASIAKELVMGTSTSVTFLRESSGSGRGGAYASVRLSDLPHLTALARALAGALRACTGCTTLGGKVLATRYGKGGINWAHQDQTLHPYQAYVLLSRPGIDFSGGELYMSEPEAVVSGAPDAELDLPWSCSGEIAIFNANWHAPGGKPWYHGMRMVHQGTDELCSMLAVGLLE